MTRTPDSYRWQRDGPRLVRRFYWRMLLVPVPVSLGLLTAGLLKLGPPEFGLWLLAAVTIALAVLGGLWVYAIGLWERRLVRQLKAADYKLCPRCGFSLAGHASDCNCPECGEVCELDSIQADWRSFRPMITSA